MLLDAFYFSHVVNNYLGFCNRPTTLLPRLILGMIIRRKMILENQVEISFSLHPCGEYSVLIGQLQDSVVQSTNYAKKSNH